MIYGLDLHAGYGVIDFDKLAASGVRFAICKATQGNEGGGKYLDAQFNRNVAECRRVGIAVGAYHFPYPLPEDGKNKFRSPEEQAQIAFNMTGGLGSQPGDLSHAVDAEWPPPEEWAKWGCTAPQISEWLRRYCVKATELFGRPPLIYTYPNYWKHLSSLADTSWASEYDLWFANYSHPGEGHPAPGKNPPLLSWVSKTWTDWAVWQYSADGSTVKVPGIVAKAVDRNVIKDEPTLARLQGLEYIELG